MILRITREYRQDKAVLAAALRKGLAVARLEDKGCDVKMRQARVPASASTFRNPSPWRQSGARLHQLPHLFISAVAFCNIERELLCLRLQKSHLPSRLSQVWQHASQTRLSIMPPRAQRSEQRQASSLVAAALTLPQALLLAPLRVLLSRFSKQHHVRGLTRHIHKHANAVLPCPGRAAFCVPR